MFVRYMALILFTHITLSGNERYTMTAHTQEITPQGQFLLCTTSGSSSIDCGLFCLAQNKPTLVLSTEIKNETIKDFTTGIVDLLAYIHNTYGISTTYACFAAPGVPSAQQDYLTHIRLPYAIDTKEILRAVNYLKSAIIVNDFMAMSYGVDYMDAQRMTLLYDAPAELHARRAIIGAGSGLGSVSMIWNEQRNAYSSLPAEAGTCDFPPQNQFELDLAIGMKQKRNMRTVHWANFVSLSGIEFTYQLLNNVNLPHITEQDGMNILANATNDTRCAMTADLFFKFYARFTYNFVWNHLPFGGIYLVGETATAHPEMLTDIFLPEYFNCVISKQPVLKRIPIYIIKDDRTLGLYGTAHYFLIEKKELLLGNSFLDTVQSKIYSLWSGVKNIFSR